MTVLAGVAIGDGAAAWAAAGFAVDGDHAQVGAVRLTFAGTDRAAGPGGGDRGIRSWALAPDAGAAVDGLPTTPPPPGGPPASPTAHPNGAVALDHLVVLSPDVGRTTDALAAAGLDLRRVRSVPASRPPRVQHFFRAGETIIELVGPETPGTPDAPAAFYGLAFTVADLDATAALLGAGLSDVRAAVQPGRRIATLRHRDLGLSVPVAFLSPPERPGAPERPAAGGPGGAGERGEPDGAESTRHRPFRGETGVTR
jgi:hypothetical protein